jgi:hypothetical protein
MGAQEGKPADQVAAVALIYFVGFWPVWVNQPSEKSDRGSERSRQSVVSSAPAVQKQAPRSSIQEMYEQIAKENGFDDENPVPTSTVSVEDWQRGGDKRHFATKTFPSGNTYKGEWLNGK